MTEFTSYPPGTFSWVDLATSNAEGAKAFYTKLFGWEAVDMPAGPDSVYTMMHLNGKSVAALYQMNPDQQAMGMPPSWTSYVTVADVAASAAKAKALGGQIMVEPMPVMDAGHMAIIQDPSGATVALWQAKEHIGAQLVNEPGCLSWNELATHNTDQATSFYTQLFGWESETQDVPGAGPYTGFKNNGRMNGGLMQMNEQWSDMPPHWMVYFAVADCDASANKVKSLGGSIGVPAMDIPSVGRFAVVQDPQGAPFTIIKLENPE